ncbi:MAG TPA: hypothetical protein VL899_14385 [Alphaproteobacteria bacterium]|nr:hypothetical protein [Alphaproteobacteria bacterium]
MPWLSAVMKLAPYAIDLGKVAVSALPHLTQRKPEAAESVEPPLRPEIVELQTAATANAENIRKMASDLSSALSAIDSGTKTIEARFRRLEILAYAAIAVSGVAIASAVAVLLSGGHGG